MTLKRILVFFKNHHSTCLYILSWGISGFFAIGHLLHVPWVILNDNPFIIIFVSFITLCNLPVVVGIIKSIVREKNK